MKITYLEPYYAGSHRLWIDSYKKFTKHELEILSLSSTNWRWHMKGGALQLSKKVDALPELFIASDMLDLPIFYAYANIKRTEVPSAIYFHENQFAYPLSPKISQQKQRESLDFGFTNLRSALFADHCFFNSRYNLESFFEGAKKFLEYLPDQEVEIDLDAIEKKCSVLPIGLNLDRIDQTEIDSKILEVREKYKDYVFILWNHRWDYDKNYPLFFKLLSHLKSKKLPFKLIMLGQRSLDSAAQYQEYKDEFKEEILNWGYVEADQEYISWLKVSDLLPVTSNQDFFGISVAEAAYCGVYPLLPDRLAYPELISTENHPENYYQSFSELKEKAESFFATREKKSYTQEISKFSWNIMTSKYDQIFQSIT